MPDVRYKYLKKTIFSIRVVVKTSQWPETYFLVKMMFPRIFDDGILLRSTKIVNSL